MAYPAGHRPRERTGRGSFVFSASLAWEQRCYLLGVTEHQITLLRELDDEEAAGWLRESDNTPASPGFLEVLGETLRKKK